MVFKRKIYDKMLKWKSEQDGKTALLIKGARRVGKSTIAEEFAKREYKSYILIDFANISKEVNSWFDDLSDLDYFFMRLQQLNHVVLYHRESVIIFDEIQLQPLARQAIKYLVRLYRNRFSLDSEKECEGYSYTKRGDKVDTLSYGL